MDGITNSMDMSLVEFWVILKYREGSHAAVLEMKESDITEELNNNSNLL